MSFHVLFYGCIDKQSNMSFSLPDRFDKPVQKIFGLAVWLLILAGIALRVILWYQNRDLVQDEANLARNLYERGFMRLAEPLSYEQYAPPLFLWIEKLAAMLAGFSEKALRFYPLLCGIASLFLFRQVLRHYMKSVAAWLPMALLACTYLFIRYSAEVKQYMPDAMVTLALLAVALETDVLKTATKRFLLIWAIAGSIAIWASMPSVFVLCGIGCYYGWICHRKEEFVKLLWVMGVAAFWGLQFGAYYYMVLQPQADSSYLQQYHANYFLSAFPSSMAEWMHNRDRLKEILGNAGGFDDYNEIPNLIFIVIAVIYLIVRRTKDFFLVVLPILLTLLASAANKFSLLERVILFMQPLVVLLIGIGFWRIMKIKFLPTQLALIGYGVYTICVYNSFWLFEKKLVFQEATAGMSYVQGQGGKGTQLYVHDATVPAYLYYTRIHPEKEKWAPIHNAHLLKWEDNYTEVTKPITDTAYFLYAGGITKEKLQEHRQEIQANLKPIAALDTFYCNVDVYVRAPEVPAKAKKK